VGKRRGIDGEKRWRREMKKKQKKNQWTGPKLFEMGDSDCADESTVVARKGDHEKRG